MRQPGAVIIGLMLHEDLGLVLEAAKGRGMDNAVPVARIAGASAALALRIEAATGLFGPRGIGRMRPRRGHDRPQQLPGRTWVRPRTGGVGFSHRRHYIEGAPETAREPCPSPFPTAPPGGSRRS